MTDILRMCIGRHPVLEQGKDQFDLRKAPAGTYVSWLKNDAGDVLGAIVSTLPAVAYLGGSMIMIPTGAQKDMVETGCASEAIIDSMAEINNMLRSAFNIVRKNDHVSPSEMVIFTPPAENSEEAWVYAAAKRIDLKGQFPHGAGYMIILSRHG